MTRTPASGGAGEGVDDGAGQRVTETAEDLLGVLADVGWRLVRPRAAAIELVEPGEHRCGHAVAHGERREGGA